MQKINREGEVGFSFSGQKMEIIKYKNANNIDIKFEDGTIVKNKRYSHFIIGNIKNPNAPINLKNEEARKERCGETVINNSGLKMTIIAYRTNKDCDVQFEDGTILRNKCYATFKNGAIAHPLHEHRHARKHVVGATNIAANGLKMTIVGYSSEKKGGIEVEFEDGYKTIVDTSAFARGEVKNPNFSRISKSTCIYKNITAKKAWNEDNKTYYICKCNKCGEANIWTPQEMIEHEKICSKQ